MRPTTEPAPVEADSGRDTKFCRELRENVESSGTHSLLLPPRSPKLNACVERAMRSPKTESLEGTIVFNEASLPNAVREYLTHDHAERIPQGLANEVIEPAHEISRSDGKVNCRKRFSGMLR